MTDAGSQTSAGAEHYVLRLYVTGSTKRSARAIETTRQICDSHLKGRHDLEVIDLYQHPEAAAREQIIAAPTLVKLLPAPLRRVIGDLSDRQRVLASLGLDVPAAATRMTTPRSVARSQSAAPHPLQREIDELRGRLAEAEETLQAIRQGEVDAVVVKGASGPQVYTLLNADRPYRNIVERMQEGALTLTPDGTVLYANQRLASFLGLALANIVGQKFGQFVAADDRDLLGELLADGGQAGGKAELALRAADGAAVPVYLSVVDLPDEGQRIISGIVTDLRWQKQRIRELAEANAKLVAAMAERERAEDNAAPGAEDGGRGSAHRRDRTRLQQPPVGDRRQSANCSRRARRDEWLKRRVEAGQRAVERGARLTQQLLAFARRQDASAPSHFRQCIAARYGAPSAQLRRRWDPAHSRAWRGTGPCLVDPTELQAAILNLATNAKDAMPDGGSLTITTEDAELDGQPDGGAGPIRGGRYLSIVVTDTGHGMPPEIRERAFDPFFTTKDVGKGTGLGLSRVYGFMRQSGGHVTIESAPGAGTSVRLYFPRTEASAMAPEPPAAAAVPQSAPAGSTRSGGRGRPERAGARGRGARKVSVTPRLLPRADPGP